mmetsp:Transcript_24905/g.64871  ORF Transcript_24905/g.64871 Transcript_24905/m.64871 type:complete len:944 (-) Transcript_24905:110-2941(-)
MRTQVIRTSAKQPTNGFVRCGIPSTLGKLRTRCCRAQRLNPRYTFFAAQTMRMKVQAAFTEVPEDSRDSLRDALCASISTLGGRSRNIAVQLALAIADLAIQMWEVWTSPAEDMIENFGSEKDLTVMVGLLEFLTVLPEEIGNPLLVLTHDDRNRVADQYGQNSVSVLPFLEHCLEEYSGESVIVERMFACLASWLKFGGKVTVPFLHSPLLPVCFEAALSPETEIRDGAIEAICSAIYLGKAREFHPGLLDQVVERSFGLREEFQAAAAADDFALAQSLARVLVESAESIVDPGLVIGETTPQHIAAIEAMGEVANYDDVDTVVLTFGFWYRFATEIYDAQLRMNNAEADAFKDQFRPFFSNLYLCLHRLVRCEEEIGAVLEREEELSDFRERVADLVRETSFIIGSESTVAMLLDACSDGDGAWNDIEAALFLMTCYLADSLKPASEVAPRLLEALVQFIMPEEGKLAELHPQLMVTILHVLGNLSHWAKRHPDESAQIWGVLHVAVRNHLPTQRAGKAKALQQDPLRVAGIRSLLELCDIGRSTMAPHLEELITLVREGDDLGFSASQTLKMIRASTEVIAHCPDEMVPAFAALVEPIDERLKADVEGGESPFSALQRVAEVCRWINVPAPLLKDVETHPLTDAFGEVLSTLEMVMRHYGDNKQVVEEANKCIKFILRALDDYAQPFVDAILDLVVSLFQEHYHPSCLYVVTGVVKTFGASEEFAPAILEVFYTLIEPTFGVLSASDDALINHPDLVDDLFRLLLATLKMMPEALYQPELASTAFQLGTATMLLRSKTAHETTTQFLQLFIGMHRTKYCRDNEREKYRGIAADLLDAEGSALVEACIQVFMGELPRMYHADCADVLFDIYLVEPRRCYGMVRAVLESERVRESRATEAQLSEFLAGFEEQWQSAVDFREELVKRFARIFDDYRSLDDGPA